MSVGRRWPSIDVVRLMSRGGASGWNAVLTKAYEDGDINSLAKLRYGLQAGMSDASKAGIKSQKLDVFFLRLQKSIEDTAKKILRLKYPNPHDNPRIPKDQRGKLALEAKKARDMELDAFFRSSAF